MDVADVILPPGHRFARAKIVKLDDLGEERLLRGAVAGAGLRMGLRLTGPPLMQSVFCNAERFWLAGAAPHRRRSS
jgi:hypothetical protein